MKWTILLLLISTEVSSSIFGNDDRMNISQTNAMTQELARSVPALIQKQRIKQISSEEFELSGVPLSKLPICPDEAFSQEKTIANCSASLIAPNKVLTAAHCLNDTDYSCSTYSVVFDYQNADNLKLHKDQIYHCKNVLYYNYDMKLPGVDLAVIELDRKVEGRNPVKTKQTISKNDELFMIGYPMGITQKLVETGKVLSIDEKLVSFKHDLDSFSVNSGGPIFNLSGEQVGVLVRGTGSNFMQYNNESCYRWHKATSQKEYSEGNDLSSIPTNLLGGK